MATVPRARREHALRRPRALDLERGVWNVIVVNVTDQLNASMLREEVAYLNTACMGTLHFLTVLALSVLRATMLTVSDTTIMVDGSRIHDECRIADPYS